MKSGILLFGIISCFICYGMANKASNPLSQLKCAASEVKISIRPVILKRRLNLEKAYQHLEQPRELKFSRNSRVKRETGATEEGVELQRPEEKPSKEVENLLNDIGVTVDKFDNGHVSPTLEFNPEELGNNEIKDLLNDLGVKMDDKDKDNGKDSDKPGILNNFPELNEYIHLDIDHKMKHPSTQKMEPALNNAWENTQKNDNSMDGQPTPAAEYLMASADPAKNIFPTRNPYFEDNSLGSLQIKNHQNMLYSKYEGEKPKQSFMSAISQIQDTQGVLNILAEHSMVIRCYTAAPEQIDEHSQRLQKYLGPGYSVQGIYRPDNVNTHLYMDGKYLNDYVDYELRWNISNFSPSVMDITNTDTSRTRLPLYVYLLGGADIRNSDVSFRYIDDLLPFPEGNEKHRIKITYLATRWQIMLYAPDIGKMAYRISVTDQAGANNCHNTLHNNIRSLEIDCENREKDRLHLGKTMRLHFYTLGDRSDVPELLFNSLLAYARVCRNYSTTHGGRVVCFLIKHSCAVLTSYYAIVILMQIMTYLHQDSPCVRSAAFYISFMCYLILYCPAIVATNDSKQLTALLYIFYLDIHWNPTMHFIAAFLWYVYLGFIYVVGLLPAILFLSDLMRYGHFHSCFVPRHCKSQWREEEGRVYLCDDVEDDRNLCDEKEKVKNVDDESLLIPITGNELEDKSMQGAKEYTLMGEDIECIDKIHNNMNKKVIKEGDSAMKKQKESLEIYANIKTEINENYDVPLNRERRSITRRKVEYTAICDIMRLFHWSMYLYSLPCLLYYVVVGLYPLPTALSVMSCVIAVEIAVFFIKKI